MKPHRASNMFRAALCPPSVWRELEIPDVEHEAASEGQMLHEMIARAIHGEKLIGLNDEQERAVESCRAFAHRLREQMPNAFFYTEEKLEVFDSKGEPIIDRLVTTDFVQVAAPVAYVVDFKTGRAENETEAPDDLQLLTYAVGVWSTFEGITRVDVHRFHPRLDEEHRHTCARYEGDDAYWRAACNKLRAIVDASTPGAPACPGQIQCRYCKAKVACDEFKGWALPDPLALPAVVNKDISVDQLSRVLSLDKRLKLLNNMMDDAKNIARTAIQNGVTIPGWALKENKPKRHVADTWRARAALGESMYVDFLMACSISVAELERLHKEATGLKGKEAREDFQARFADVIEMKPTAPSLVEVE